MSTLATIAKQRLAAADWPTLDVRALLLDASQPTDPARDYVSELAGEVSGTYARVALANKSVTRDDANARVVLRADDAAFDPLDVGALDRMVLYVAVTDDADSWIVAYYSVTTPAGGQVVTNGGRLVVPADPVAGYVVRQ